VNTEGQVYNTNLTITKIFHFLVLLPKQNNAWCRKLFSYFSDDVREHFGTTV
jgi:hypothetical protein